MQSKVCRPSAKRGFEPWEPVGLSEEAMWSTRNILVTVHGGAETPNEPRLSSWVLLLRSDLPVAPTSPHCLELEAWMVSRGEDEFVEAASRIGSQWCDRYR